MAEIKDKVVTVESLGALHEHNKEAYMAKDNPAGSGSFSMNRKADTDVGNYSTAIGLNTAAIGDYSYAEGSGTTAKVQGAHTEGWGTVASTTYQHVQGIFNVEDTDNKYAHIVGNGSRNAPSNAHTVDWDGNSWFAGDVYVGGNSQDDGTKLVKSTNIMSIEYGDTLPAAGTVGRIFFKKLSE